MKLSALIQGIAIKYGTGGDVEIQSLCADSRVAGEGDLFFCYERRREVGQMYAEEAVKRGVSAVVGEFEYDVACPQIVVENGRIAMAQLSAAFYRNPERDLRMVAVTGTNGKTTVAHMISSILKANGERVGLIGTLGAEYEGVTVPPSLTTPDPVSLFALLSDMREKGVETVVMEVSAHALALGKVSPITFDVSVFTNLSRDHLDDFQTMEAYGSAKRTLFLPQVSKRAVVNADDPFSRTLPVQDCVTYGLDNPADVFAVVESASVDGSRIMLNLNDELCEADVKMTGRHNVYNAMAASAAARVLGASLRAVSVGLSSLQGVHGRLERVADFRGAHVFVDFAHTPDGLEKSLLSLREFCSGKLVCVFGCGGNRDAEKRPLMGEVAAKYADFSVITSDNPRYEDACEIIAQIEKGFRKVSRNYVTVQEREKGTQYALERIGDGDILLVAGKGGETYQEIMGIKYTYSDKTVIKSLIEKLG